MDLLRDQCRNHELYPKHLEPQSKGLVEYFDRFENRSESLFCEAKNALLECLDLDEGAQGWYSSGPVARLTETNGLPHK